MRCECTIGRLRDFVDQGASPQFVKLQRRVHAAHVVKVAVEQTVEEMPDVEPASEVGGIRVSQTRPWRKSDSRSSQLGIVHRRRASLAKLLHSFKKAPVLSSTSRSVPQSLRYRISTGGYSVPR